MDKLGGHQPQKLHVKGPQGFPYFFTGRQKLRTKIPLRFFLIKILQSRIRSQRVQEISVKGQPHLFIDQTAKKFLLRLSFPGNQTVKSREHFFGKNHRPRINIHTILLIHRSAKPQCFHRLLVQESLYIAVLSSQKHTVFPSGFHMLFKGNRRPIPARIVDQKRIKKKKHIPGQKQHPLPHPGWHRGHCDHKLIKKRRRPAVWQFMRHRGKKLSQGGILRHPFAVPTGVDHQNTQPRKIRPARLLRHVLQNAQGSAAAPHPLSLRIRNHGKLGLQRQKPGLPALLELSLEPLCLPLI